MTLPRSAPEASATGPGRGPSAATIPPGQEEREQNAGPESKARPGMIKLVYEPPRGRGFTITGVKS